MSGPSWRNTSFDFAAAPRNCSRSKLATAGMSRSMMNLRKAMSASQGNPEGDYVALTGGPQRAQAARKTDATARPRDEDPAPFARMLILPAKSRISAGFGRLSTAEHNPN